MTRVQRNSRGAVTAVRDVSLVFAPGSRTAVMGASGPGKTTLLHCATGALDATLGSVLTAAAALRDPRTSVSM